MREGDHKPSDLEVDIALGVASALERRKRPEEAVEVYLDVLQREGLTEPALEQALIRVASIALDLGHSELARWALNRLLNEAPFTPCSVWARSTLRRLDAHSGDLGGDGLGGTDPQAP